jgi:hypothetical protein
VNSILFKSLMISFISIYLGSGVSLAQEDTQSTAAVVTFSPTHKLVLTTTDGIVGVERKAAAIRKIIENTPDNTVLHLVFSPTSHNAKAYSDMTALLTQAIDEARSARNVRVKTQLVNIEVAQASFEAFAHSSGVPLDTAYVNFENDGLLTFDDVPKNLVEKLDRNASVLSNMWGVAKDTGRSLVEAGRETSFSGLVLATSLTGLGYSSLGPSYVYVSEGELSLAAITSMALSTALLYTIPRHENLTQKIYEVGFELTRSIKESFRYVVGSPLRYFTNRNFYLSEANPVAYNAFRTTMGLTLYSFAVQSTFYYLQDGTAIWNPENIEYMMRNSVLIGAASSPWTFATQKLKSETSLSNNLVTHLRTAQLLLIGHLAVSIQTAMEAKAYNINQEEFTLIGLGALGLLANKYGVRLVNKLDKRPWFQFLNKNIEAITNSPGTLAKNIFRRLSGKSRLAYGFVSLENATLPTAAASNQCIEFLEN